MNFTLEWEAKKCKDSGSEFMGSMIIVVPTFKTSSYSPFSNLFLIVTLNSQSLEKRPNIKLTRKYNDKVGFDS
jgi:hypothetical protein